MEVEMKIRGLMMDPVTNMPIVVLKDVQGQTILPIWVGVYEANAIALEKVRSTIRFGCCSRSVKAVWSENSK
jgi:bifunctional DNase/RNase